MRRRLFVGIAAAAVVLAVVASGMIRAQQAKTRVFMRAKLTHTQQLLEALATRDFAALEKQANELASLTQAAGWQVLQTPAYRRESVEFERSAYALAKTAKAKNLDGAALAYVQITLSCVSCHKYLRKSQFGKIEPPASVPTKPAEEKE